jgi:hypothetical protein
LDLLREYNNIIYTKGETIKSFITLYNQILEIIRPHNQASLMYYYNTVPFTYRHRLEENNANSLGSALHTCLEFEEQLERTWVHIEYYAKHNGISIVLQLVQDMRNQMIYFKIKGVLPPLLQLKLLPRFPLGTRLIIFSLNLFFLEPVVIFVK